MILNLCVESVEIVATCLILKNTFVNLKYNMALLKDFFWGFLLRVCLFFLMIFILKYTIHICNGEEICFSNAVIDCSLLELNALIAIPCTLGLQAEHSIPGSNKVLQRNKTYCPAK